jgi:Dyp-type peroxidase family
MLLLTSDDEERLELALSEVLPIVQDNHVEVGRVLRDEQCRPREHFGYLDGRSQPLFFKDALDKDTSVARWKPAAPLKLALIADPGAEDKGGYGSFLVFRKLQQDVAQFDAMVGDLAQAIDPAEPDLARAGAMLMGRFKDGTPLVLSDKPEALPVPANDFDHKTEDPHFLRCPAFAHTRRSNPRSDQPDQTTKVQQSRIARRGVPYGEPGDKEVGLLFAAFMSSIVGQFVTIQRSWANTPHFMLGQPGIDPVIGQGAANPDQDFPKHWNGVPDDSRKTFRLEHAVTLLGGDYFFAPSIPFLDSLKDPA